MSSLLLKTAGGIGCAVFVLPLLAALAIAALMGRISPGGSLAAASPSAYALADIPAQMLALYRQAAATCPGLPWNVLAAIGKAETDHGRTPAMVSTAGAVGPMQFEPATFTEYAYPVPPGGKAPPTPWDPIDAVYAAARLLCADGARGGTNLRSALWNYNHSDHYVDEVMHIANAYAAAEPAPTAAAATAVAFARAQLGTPYLWGGDGPAHGDIGFDCSGLTQAAYAAAGIPLPRIAQDQYNAGPRLPPGAPLLPGDLLFYGTSPGHITHVALYTGGGRAIEAPHPGAVVRAGPAEINTPSFQGATRPTMPGGGGGR